jgi:hypothetical protein
MRYPLDSFWIAQEYSAAHPALDLAAPAGAAILAPENGRVTIVNGNHNAYFGGKYVVITGDSGYRYYFGHNSANHVSLGQMVVEGQHIADVGMTGFALASQGISAPTGPHVHFEVSRGGTTVDFRSVMNEGESMAGGAMDWKARNDEATRIADERLAALGIKDDEIADLRQALADKDAFFAKVWQIAEDRLADISKYQARITELEMKESDSDMLDRIAVAVEKIANK